MTHIQVLSSTWWRVTTKAGTEVELHSDGRLSGVVAAGEVWMVVEKLRELGRQA